MRHRHQVERMQDFNRYDVERILKEVLSNLDRTNEQVMKLLNTHGESLGEPTINFFLEDIQNNSAQMVRLSSLIIHQDDIFRFFSNGPLIRKDEVEL